MLDSDIPNMEYNIYFQMYGHNEFYFYYFISTHFKNSSLETISVKNLFGPGISNNALKIASYSIIEKFIKNQLSQCF